MPEGERPETFPHLWSEETAAGGAKCLKNQKMTLFSSFK
jgi:hypothetical protein